MTVDPGVAELTEFSPVVASTARGKEIVDAAMRAGYLKLKPAERWKLVKSQQGLLENKGSVWGRRLALRVMGLPITRLKGLDLFHCWRALSWSARFRSIFGTLRRVIQRGYYRRLRLDPATARAVGKPFVPEK